jgi:hypothetical protein
MCRGGAAVKNLAQSASVHAGENNAPSKPGTEHLAPVIRPLSTERFRGTGRCGKPRGARNCVFRLYDQFRQRTPNRPDIRATTTQRPSYTSTKHYRAPCTLHACLGQLC